jgi:small conductance mechanosensitive channel
MQVADTLGSTFDSARVAASEARETLLDSTFWLGVGLQALRLVLIVALALFVLAVVRRLKRRWVRRVQNHPTTDKRRQRVLTVADLLGSVAKYVVWGIATIMLLEAVGFNIGPLLAGAGIAGLAIGFGAQTLVRDVISGLFLLFDDTIGVGDLIRFGPDEGEVEYVGLRLIKVRKFDGELLMIPAGELRVFGNKSVGFARAIVDVGLSYEQDVNEALKALEGVAREWAETEAAREAMLEEAPQVQAVTSLGDSAVTVLVVAQVRPGAQFQAERDLRRLIKARFDEMGVEIPFPRRTVYVKSADGGTSAGDETAAAGA